MSPSALAGSVGKPRGSDVFFCTLAAFLLCQFGLLTGALAQRADLVDGTAIVSVFSGLVPDNQGNLSLDPDGISIRAFDLTNAGSNADGPDEIVAIKTRSIGQVFAVAIDNADRPAVYLGATSLFGLYRTPDNSDWDPAMWGRNGGPGTIYRLHPDNGYQPEAFTDIRNGQRENSGPGLGDIAVDPISGLLFVSDLETGLIHSVDLKSGEMVDTYDHGIDGRADFMNPETNLTESLDTVPWNILGTGPGICGAESTPDSAGRFMSDPACWRYASFQRRVFALGIHYDEDIGETRLYYSIWASSGFGDSTWAFGAIESRNSIWSIALDTAGRFDLSDIRREIIMPAFFTTGDDRAMFGESQPVASITFTDDGTMLVAERGVPLGLDPDDDESPLVAEGSARILRFILENGKWVAENSDAPNPQASYSGGVAPGYGYTQLGRVDPDNWGATIWATGNRPCASKSDCNEDGTGGLRGTATPVTSPSGPGATLFVDIGTEDKPATMIGDVAIFRLDTDEPMAPVAEDPPQPQSQAQTGIDFTLALKSDQPTCRQGSECKFTLELGNQGADIYRGQLMFSDTTDPNFTLSSIFPGNWNCVNARDSFLCHAPDVTLPPRATIEINLTFNVGPGISNPEVRNCAVIDWPDQGGRPQILAVQVALQNLGIDAGTPDGLSGPRTRAAIREAELTNNLPPTGEISDALLQILFGPGRGASPETDTENNSACATVDVDIPPAPVGAGRNVTANGKFQSRNENNSSRAQVRTHNRSTSQFHERYSSSMYQGRGGNGRSVPVHRRPLSQFHQTNRSGRHDGTISRGVDIHDPVVSRFHDTYASSLHNNRTSQRYPVHIVGRSEFHQTRRSWVHDGTVSRQVPAE